MQGGFGITLDLVGSLDGLTVGQVGAMEANAPIFAVSDASDLSTCQLSPSYDQERFWCLEALRPTKCLFNIQYGYEIQGTLNRDVFTECVRNVASNSESLLSVFRMKDGHLVRRILDSSSVALRQFDSIDVSTGDIKRLAEQERLQPFNLEIGPLVRFCLLEADSRRHVFLLTAHHIVCDARSLEIFLQQTCNEYRSRISGLPFKNFRETHSFAGFVEWERTFVKTQQCREDLKFWGRYLKPTGRDLSQLDHGLHSEKDSTQGSWYSFELQRDSIQGLETLAKQEGATAASVFLSAFTQAIHYQTGEEKLAIGLPVAGRPDARWARTVGLFAHPILLRVDMAGCGCFRDALTRVRVGLRQILPHQNVPFALIAAAAGRNAMFKIVFSFITQKSPDCDVSGLKFVPIDMPMGTTDCDLFLTIVDESDRVRGSLFYKTNRYSHSDISNIVTQYIEIVRGCYRLT